MVPMEGFALKQHRDNYGEDEQGDDLLNDLQLNERKGTSIIDKTNTISGHLAHVFKEGNPPRKGDNGNQGPILAYPCFAQLQVTIPRKGHKNIAQHEQEYGIDS